MTEKSPLIDRKGLTTEQKLDKICAALKDEDWMVRGWSAAALGNLGDIRALSALEELERSGQGVGEYGYDLFAAKAIAEIKAKNAIQPKPEE